VLNDIEKGFAECFAQLTSEEKKAIVEGRDEWLYGLEPREVFSGSCIFPARADEEEVF